MQNFIERHLPKIQGVISCFDRMVLTGTIPGICYAAGMTGVLRQQNIRIFDYPKWAAPLREMIRAQAEAVAQQDGLTIEFIRKKDFRKEERVKEILSRRGDHPGLVHIFSAMEPCTSYKPWHDKNTHKTFLKFDSGKCLHYYFYLIDPVLGLCYLRVPTWAPFRLQFYFNGHYHLANRLAPKGIPYTMQDNAFVDIGDFQRAQALSNNLNIPQIHRRLERYAQTYCPALKHLKQTCHWSIMQAEYATDIIFKKPGELAPIYEELVRTAVHAVRADNIATFLGRKVHPRYQGEMGNDYSIRIQGTRIKHHMGPVSIKMYDKHGRVLRIETTVNNAAFFKHYRSVEHRDGTTSLKQAPLRKHIYSLAVLRDRLQAANDRYLAFISAIDDPTPALKVLDKISQPAQHNGRSFRGFNLFNPDDWKLLLVILRGEFNINGLTNRQVRKHLGEKTPHQVSRQIKRLRLHGLIKKVGKTYKYYLTKLGRKVITAALKTKEMVLIPLLRGTLAAG